MRKSTGRETRRGTASASDHPGRPAPRPVTRGVVLRLLGTLVALALVLTGIGLVLTKVFGSSDVVGFDQAVIRQVVRDRTPTLDRLTDVGSSLSDTPVAIAATAVLMVVLRVWLGRWRESLVVLTAIGGELLYFLVVTNAVDRQRPGVRQLDEAPPTSSFPSGHTAAAVALYGCVAVVLLRQMQQRMLARILAILCFCVPVAVGVSRVYRGMHFPSDVVFGALGGGIWLMAVVAALMPAAAYGSRALERTAVGL
jgi:undecaprenyl-diphosphatase